MPSIQPGMSRMSRPQLYHNIGRNWSILIYIDLTFLGSKKRYFCDVFATNIWTLQTLHILKSSSDSSHCSYFMLLWPPHHISSWAKESQTMTTSAESPLGSGGFVAATFLKLGHLEAPGCDVAKHQGARWIVQYCPILSNIVQLPTHRFENHQTMSWMLLLSGLSRTPFREGDALNFVSKPQSLVIQRWTFHEQKFAGISGNWDFGKHQQLHAAATYGYTTAAITLSLASGLTMETRAGLANEDLEIKALMGLMGKLAEV